MSIIKNNASQFVFSEYKMMSNKAVTNIREDVDELYELRVGNKMKINQNKQIRVYETKLSKIIT